MFFLFYVFSMIFTMSYSQRNSLPSFGPGDLRSLKVRLKTFNNLTIRNKVDALTCARLGFFYSNEKFKCWKCDCAFRYDSNIENLKNHNLKSNMCKIFDKEIRFKTNKFKKIKKFFEYEVLRLLTLSQFPKSRIISAESLAKSGFFYIFNEDCVMCVFCRRGLKKWPYSSDPNHEHAKFYKQTCPFINWPEITENILTNFQLLDLNVCYLGLFCKTSTQKQLKNFFSFFIDLPLYETDLFFSDTNSIEFKERVKVFKNNKKFQLSNERILRLVKNGFHSDNKNEIRCFECNTKLYDNFSACSLALIHFLLSPDCKLSNFFLKQSNHKDQIERIQGIKIISDDGTVSTIYKTTLHSLDQLENTNQQFKKVKINSRPISIKNIKNVEKLNKIQTDFKKLNIKLRFKIKASKHFVKPKKSNLKRSLNRLKKIFAKSFI